MVVRAGAFHHLGGVDDLALVLALARSCVVRVRMARIDCFYLSAHLARWGWRGIRFPAVTVRAMVVRAGAFHHLGGVDDLALVLALARSCVVRVRMAHTGCFDLRAQKLSPLEANVGSALLDRADFPRP